MISVCFQGKSFNITIIQVYALISNAEEAEIEPFYEELLDLLELIPKKGVLFIIGGWNAKVGNQEIPRIIGKFGLGVQNEAGQKLTEFCQENALVIANTLFQQHKRSLHMDITWWSILKSDCLCSLQPKIGKLYTVSKTSLWADCGSDHELLAKFRLKLKKVGKTTRPFRYDFNQIPYDYMVEVTNKFKGLDLIGRVP